jgi:hypothetical protein
VGNPENPKPRKVRLYAYQVVLRVIREVSMHMQVSGILIAGGRSQASSSPLRNVGVGAIFPGAVKVGKSEHGGLAPLRLEVSERLFDETADRF